MLVPLKKKRLYEEISAQIISMIQSGELKPGDRLPPEKKLAEDMDVSRTAIREALRSLESMGYIRSKVGGGTYIDSITLQSAMGPFSAVLSQDHKLIEDLLEVRRLLETRIAFLAAEKIDAEKSQRLQAALDAMRGQIDAGGNGLEGDDAFHLALADAAGNEAMKIILGMCGLLITASREATLSIPGQPRNSLTDHEGIFEAVSRGESAEAQARMDAHLLKAQRLFRQKKASQGV
jgi:GntR family transcriptional regulator, transcriptional repressor for pyruvate dehydrogenase complex